VLIEYLDNTRSAIDISVTGELTVINPDTIAIAITAEVMAIDHELLMQLWIKLQQLNDINLPVARVLIQAIANLLPRRDTMGKGFRIDGLTNAQLETLFIGEDCELIKEHKPKLVAKARDVTVDGAPIAPSGNPTSDLLAQLTRQFEGRFSEALNVINTLSYNALDAYQRTYAEVCRDPEERTKEYVLAKYREQVENDPRFKMAALGMEL